LAIALGRTRLVFTHRLFLIGGSGQHVLGYKSDPVGLGELPAELEERLNLALN
jgi:hypothetical protein